MNITKTLLLISLFMITGCNNAYRINDVDKTMVNIDISTNLTKSSTTADDNHYLFEGEYKINSVRVITFDGDILDNNTYFSITETQNTAKNIRLKLNVRDIKEKLVYVLVNEPESLKQDLGTLGNINDLTELEYSINSYFVGAEGAAFSYDNAQNTNLGFENLPMSGFTTIDPVEGGIYPVIVYRTLARVDVWLRGADSGFRITTKTALAYNATGKGNYFGKDVTSIPTNALVNNNKTAKELTLDSGVGTAIGTAGKYKRLFTFYTPEQKNSLDSELAFIITGVLYNGYKINSSEVILPTDDNGDSVGIIKRNNVYQAYCTIDKKMGTISVKYLVEEWNTVITTIPPFE